MRLAFMGTPDFSVPILAELLAAGHEVAAVYTQPPRAAGRGQRARPSPVQAFAESRGLEVRHPKSLKSEDEQAAFAALGLDAAVVVAYGLILPKAVLAAPRLGCLNLHASLLPRWRGAAPIQRAIMAGDTETGVMVMQMDEGLDTGPVLLAERVAIGERMTAGELHDLLSRTGATLMVRALSALESGALDAAPQAEEGATYAKKIEKDEAKVDWKRSSAEIDRQIRALTPFPGAWFEAPCASGETVRVKILRARPVSGSAEPGTVLRGATPQCKSLVIACGEGALEIEVVQKSGKAPCEAEAFLRGFSFAAGKRAG